MSRSGVFYIEDSFITEAENCRKPCPPLMYRHMNTEKRDSYFKIFREIPFMIFPIATYMKNIGTVIHKSDRCHLAGARHPGRAKYSLASKIWDII